MAAQFDKMRCFLVRRNDNAVLVIAEHLFSAEEIPRWRVQRDHIHDAMLQEDIIDACAQDLLQCDAVEDGNIQGMGSRFRADEGFGCEEVQIMFEGPLRRMFSLYLSSMASQYG